MHLCLVVELQDVFWTFASFGHRATDANKEQIDGVRFTKMMKDCGIVNKKLTAADCDLIFAKVRTHHIINKQQALFCTIVVFSSCEMSVGVLGTLAQTSH